jgi:hypothetical protein
MSNLQHTFTVSQTSVTVDIDVSVNVVKRRETVAFRESLSTSAASIAYVLNNSIHADTSLSIADRSTSLAANRVIDTGYTTYSGISTITANTEDFVITDVFVETENTIQSVPLFYKHVIDSNKLPRQSSGALDTNYELQEVVILDQYFQPIGLTEKYVDTTNGIVYLNLQSEYNSSTDYSIYYIQYKFVDASGSVFTHQDLLSVEPVYQLATFSDLDGSLAIIQDGRKVYLIEEQASQFVITLPISGAYAYQSIGSGRIRILPPVSGGISDNWFVRISNSKFYTSINSVRHQYSIAEFLTQSFAPEPPIKVVSLEDSTVLTKTLLKLDHKDIVQDDDLELFINIEVTNASGTGIAAFTTDSSSVGDIASNSVAYVMWSNTSRVGIKSVDNSTGIVDIEGLDLLTSYTVNSDYYYKETHYEYNTINFNPVSNRDILTGRTVLFLDPDTPSTNKDQTLYYLRTDKTGRVTESNYAAFDNTSGLWGDPASDPIVYDKTLYYETLPDFLTSGVDDIGDVNYVDPSGLDFFVTNYTVEGDSNSSNFLILGDITVDAGISADRITTFDSRNRGGGIIESQYESVLESNREAAWVWDKGNWDGVPYPGNASYYIEVPVNVLDGAGGTLKKQEVRKIVERHTAAGVYPVVKAYGLDIDITSVEPSASGVLIRWESDGY